MRLLLRYDLRKLLMLGVGQSLMIGGKELTERMTEQYWSRFADTGHGMKLWEKIKMGLRFVKSWGKPPAHTHSFSPADLASLMEDAGFVIETSKVIGDKTKALYLIGRKDGSA